MVNKLLVITAVLLCATLTATASGFVDATTFTTFKPFCYCPCGYVARYINVWPYYKCYKFVRDLASWAEAKVYCGVMHARMAEDKDTATHNWLRMKLRSLRLRNHHHLLEKQEYWLGATDLECEGRWMWDPSNTLVTGRFWMRGEPNNYLGYQNCMAIKRRPGRYYYDWIDDDCYQKKFYICERPSWCCWNRSCLSKLDASKVEYKKHFLPLDALKEKPLSVTGDRKP